MNKNYKVFTHTDLDGVSCGIIAKRLLQQDTVDVEHCSYENINDRVHRFIKFGESKLGGRKCSDYDAVFITDISVSEHVAELINDKDAVLDTDFKLLDHHKTAKWLNEYDWAYVSVESPVGLSSGTSLFYDYLTLSGLASDSVHTKYLSKFVEKVRRYDSWEWYNIYKDTESKKLNDLFQLIGRDRFVQHAFKTKDPNDISEFETMLNIEEENKKKYYNKVKKNMQTKNIGSYKVGIAILNQDASDIGNKLLKDYEDKDLDFVAMINAENGTVSLRSRESGADVSEVAEKYDGGGHARAAGFSIPEGALDNLIENIFD